MLLVLLILLAGNTVSDTARLPFIVGGDDIDEVGKWPWQGSLQVQGLSHFCGCVVLSKDWLLTASSCFMLPSWMTVVLLGAHDVRTRRHGDPTYYTIKHMIKHPDFSSGAGDEGYPHDIGLIKLRSSANVNSSYIAPIKLASTSDGDFLDAECFITGWGFTKSGMLPANVLKEAHTAIMTHTACDRAWTSAIGPGLIQTSHVCVGGTGTEGACSGDSGGPVMCNKGADWLLVGVTSWGMNTCDVTYPTVCTRVTSYRQWIADVTKDDIPFS